jgi:hypothetical protein
VENHGYLKCAVGAGLMHFIYWLIIFDDAVNNLVILCVILNLKRRVQKRPWPLSTYCPGIGLGVPKNPTKTARLFGTPTDPRLFLFLVTGCKPQRLYQFNCSVIKCTDMYWTVMCVQTPSTDGVHNVQSVCNVRLGTCEMSARMQGTILLMN